MADKMLDVDWFYIAVFFLMMGILAVPSIICHRIIGPGRVIIIRHQHQIEESMAVRVFGTSEEADHGRPQSFIITMTAYKLKTEGDGSKVPVAFDCQSDSEFVTFETFGILKRELGVRAIPFPEGEHAKYTSPMFPGFSFTPKFFVELDLKGAGIELSAVKLGILPATSSESDQTTHKLPGIYIGKKHCSPGNFTQLWQNREFICSNEPSSALFATMVKNKSKGDKKKERAADETQKAKDRAEREQYDAYLKNHDHRGYQQQPESRDSSSADQRTGFDQTNHHSNRSHTGNPASRNRDPKNYAMVPSDVESISSTSSTTESSASIFSRSSQYSRSSTFSSLGGFDRASVNRMYDSTSTCSTTGEVELCQMNKEEKEFISFK